MPEWEVQQHEGDAEGVDSWDCYLQPQYSGGIGIR
jgi:hypothetical protein